MPPVRMTRAEYEAMYGTKPVVASSSLDNDPIPVRMTRAEYNARYRPELTQQQDNGFIADLRRGGTQAVEAINRGVEQQNELNQRGFLSRQFGRFTTGLEAAGGALASLGEGVFRALPGGTTAANFIGDVSEAGLKTVAESPVGQGAGIAFEALPEGVQTFAEDVGRGAMGALGIGGALVAPGVTGAVARPVARSANDVFQGLKTQALRPRNDRAVERVANEIANIENNYPKTRSKLDRDPFVVESRARIAQSNVLDGAVDSDGLIRTKQKGGAIDQYKNTPITADGLTLLDVEDVVKRNLDVEAKTVNINELRANMFNAMMDSGLEGADLSAAIRRVDKDLEGLAIRADEFGNVLLSKIQDAKISTTKNIDYTKPVGTTYRKTLAHVYKETIEDKSDLPVKEWNQALQKYYRDIDRLADLDGKLVKGGRLGKLTASVTGSAIGAVAGTAGGGTGALLGGVVGGEVAAGLAGRAMSRTFRRGVDGRMPESQVLAQAQARAQAGLRDLKTADRPVGASKAIMADPNMPEAVKKEIVKVEGQIKKNVKQQNDAIKKGDFTLVAALKDVYTVLVDRLKQIINDYKNMTPGEKQGGFIGQNPFRKENQATDSNAPANAQNISSTVDEADIAVKSTAVEDATPSTNLLEEAKGKSLEEFIESQGKTVHHATDSGVFDPADFDVTKAAKGEQYFNPLGQGMYVSSNPDFVKRFGRNRMELVLPANAKIKTITQDEWLSGYGMDLVNEAFEEMGGMPSNISQTELNRVVRNAPIDALNQVDSLISQKEGLEVADKFVEALNKIQTKRNSKFDAIVYEATDYAFDADEIVIPDPSILKTRTQLEDIWRQANKADTPNANLLEEAKGKSLEEFKRAQPTVYHGSPEPLERFDNSKGGVYFTEDYYEATGFAGTPDNTYEGFLNFEKPLVIDAKGAKWDEIDTPFGNSTQEVVSNAQKDGYDGIVFRNIIDNTFDDVEVGTPGNIYYAYKPEDAFINESQLEDIWKQANE